MAEVPQKESVLLQDQCTGKHETDIVNRTNPKYKVLFIVTIIFVIVAGIMALWFLVETPSETRGVAFQENRVRKLVLGDLNPDHVASSADNTPYAKYDDYDFNIATVASEMVVTGLMRDQFQLLEKGPSASEIIISPCLETESLVIANYVRDGDKVYVRIGNKLAGPISNEPTRFSFLGSTAGSLSTSVRVFYGNNIREEQTAYLYGLNQREVASGLIYGAAFDGTNLFLGCRQIPAMKDYTWLGDGYLEKENNWYYLSITHDWEPGVNLVDAINSSFEPILKEIKMAGRATPTTTVPIIDPTSGAVHTFSISPKGILSNEVVSVAKDNGDVFEMNVPSHESGNLVSRDSRFLRVTNQAEKGGASRYIDFYDTQTGNKMSVVWSVDYLGTDTTLAVNTSPIDYKAEIKMITKQSCYDDSGNSIKAVGHSLIELSLNEKPFGSLRKYPCETRGYPSLVFDNVNRDLDKIVFHFIYKYSDGRTEISMYSLNLSTGVITKIMEIASESELEKELKNVVDLVTFPETPFNAQNEFYRRYDYSELFEKG